MSSATLQRHYGECDVDWAVQIRGASAYVEDSVGGYPECVQARWNMTIKFDCGDAAGLLLCAIERSERAAGRIDGIRDGYQGHEMPSTYVQRCAVGLLFSF